MAKIADKKKAKLAEIAANAAIAGVKVKKLKASVSAASEAEACDQTLIKMAVSADDAACLVSTGGRRRGLLADGVFNVEIAVNPETVDAAAAESKLQASGVTVTVVEEDPSAVLATVVSGDDLAALNADTKGAADAQTAATVAETESTAAATELKTAEDEVASVESTVATLTTAAATPPPPYIAVDNSGGSSSATGSSLFRIAATLVACAAVTLFMA